MLKTVKDACKLHPNALDIRVSDQIEQLDQLISAEGDGKAFFAKTHITAGMAILLKEGIARLAGKSSQSAFHLKQSMGGGKTHLLVGFGLLAKSPTLREAISKEAGGLPGQDAFGKARVAAFNGRNSPPGFFWGELADQLGKGEDFKRFWKDGPKAPDPKDWAKLFAGDQPCLILLDEMPPYFNDLDTKPIGNGTVADIAVRAFANLLIAAGQRSNACVVISDLEAAYRSGQNLINRALGDAAKELGRVARTITPVDLSGTEVYDILRKRLFAKLPTDAERNDVAAAYGAALAEASKAKITGRGAEALADEVDKTYPFHPLLKNVIALFKENESFQQTRGLMELVSRLLRSVWERPTNDVFLIGPQHFDLAIDEVRDKLASISLMPDVIAKDLWDSTGSGHAQLIDAPDSSDAAAQVGVTLLMASLSTAVNAVRGLTKEELVQCLTAPNRRWNEFEPAFEQLQKDAWFLHKSPEGRLYFDKQHNLTKLLQELASKAPENLIDSLIRHRLEEMFKPTRKAAYTEVLALPVIEDAAEKVKKGRVLLIISPDSKMPPEEVAKFFAAITKRNNVLVLTGDKSTMGSVDKAARHVFAGEKAAATTIIAGHPQRAELEAKLEQYAQDFTSTLKNLFDKVFFPRQLPDKLAELTHKALDYSRDNAKVFNGEEQIEKTLTEQPLKLYLSVKDNIDPIRVKAERLLFPAGLTEGRWTDIVDASAEQAGMPWLPPKGLEEVKAILCSEGRWQDLGNGYVTCKPKPKRTSVQVVPQTEPDDDGKVRLSVGATDCGPTPRIHYAENGAVTTKSPILKDGTLTTNAIKVQFLAVDPTGKNETGEPYTFTNKLTIRFELRPGSPRKAALYVVPKPTTISYSLDGSEPRNGTPYSTPFVVKDSGATLAVFAELDEVEAKDSFHIDPVDDKDGKVRPIPEPGIFTSKSGTKELGSRASVYEALKIAKEGKLRFESVALTTGQGAKSVGVNIPSAVTGEYIESILAAVDLNFSPSDPITMRFRKVHFGLAADLTKLFGVLQQQPSADEISGVPK